jgi:hypothetical protein
MKLKRPTSELALNEAMATVTACKYEFGAGQALAFGIPLRKHFRISFNYWVNEELHTGEFMSSTAVPQGTLFPITYNPDAPHEHSHPQAADKNKRLIVPVLLALLLTLICFTTLRSCFSRPTLHSITGNEQLTTPWPESAR